MDYAAQWASLGANQAPPGNGVMNVTILGNQSSPNAKTNNPGNLRPTGANTGFQSFPTPEDGLQAIDKNLQAYGKDGVNTLAGVINKWAPPSENDTTSYIADAAKRLGISPDQKIDLTNPVQRQAIGTAIILHEQGPAHIFGAQQEPPPDSTGGQPQTPSGPQSGSTDYAAQWNALGNGAPASIAPTVAPQSIPASTQVVQQEPQSGDPSPGLWGGLTRQVGLTARAGIQGIASDIGVVSNPIDSLLHTITGIDPTTANEFGSKIADALGLPQPKTATERVAQMAASGMAGAAGIGGAASLGAKTLTGLGKAVMGSLAEGPAATAISGAGAGAGSQLAKESGAGPMGQLGAAVAGGILAPSAAGLAMKGVPAAWNKAASAVAEEKNLITGAAPAFSASPAVEAPAPVIRALENTGIDPNSIPPRALAQINKDVQSATNAGVPVAEDQIARIARAAKFGTELTAAQITQDPALAQAEFNNEGIAAAGKTIRDFKMANERNFLSAINDKISSYAPSAHDSVGTAGNVISTLKNIDSGLKENVNNDYTVARSMVGSDTPVPMQPIAQTLGQLHEEEGINQLGAPVLSFLKKRGLLDAQGNPAPTQNMTFTVQDADRLRKVMNRNSPPATDAAAIRTATQFRNAVNDAEGMLADAPNEVGSAAASAFAKARASHAARMALQESVPALKAASQGVSPDKFMQDFVYGNNKSSSVEATQNMIRLLDSAGQSQTVNDIRADFGRQIKGAIQPRGGWQSDAPISGDGAVKMLNSPVMQRKLQAIMGDDAPDWNQAAQVASDLKFMPSRTHAQVSGNYAAIGSLLEKMDNKPAGGAMGTLAEIGKGVPFVGPYAGRVAEGFAIRGQNNATSRFINSVTSGRLPVNSGRVVVSGPSVPIGSLLAPNLLSGTPPSADNKRNK